MATVTENEQGVKVISFKGLYAKTGAIERFIQIIWTFVLVHYFLWIVVFIAAFWMLWIKGYAWLVIVLVLAYLPSFFNNDQLKLGRPWDAVRNSSMWHWTQKYMEMESTREAKLDPKQTYVFGAYPHGILILSRVNMYGGVFDQLFPGIEQRVLGATPMFWVPGSREICMYHGAVDANKKTASRILDKGMSLIVYPGGSKEIFSTDPSSKDTVLVLRKGFVKLAMQHGAHLVPTFVFGEKWVYKRMHIPRLIQNFLMKTLKLPIILFWGRWFTWIPLRKPLSVVYGKPIPVTKVAEPTQQQVDELHGQFMKEIQRIFDQYKSNYGYSAEERLVFKEAERGE